MRFMENLAVAVLVGFFVAVIVFFVQTGFSTAAMKSHSDAVQTTDVNFVPPALIGSIAASVVFVLQWSPRRRRKRRRRMMP
jgi:hypothetical protein